MSNQYIAECYVAFKDIVSEENDAAREQSHLKLSRPVITGMRFKKKILYTN